VLPTVSVQAQIGYQTDYLVKGIGEGTMMVNYGDGASQFISIKGSTLVIVPKDDYNLNPGTIYTVDAYTAQSKNGQSYKIVQAIKIEILAAPAQETAAATPPPPQANTGTSS
jgi:hypothetical protein